MLSVQEDSAIAEIVQSCDGIAVGMQLKPFEPEPVPLARRGLLRPVSEPTSAEALASAAVIVSSPVDLVTLGQDHLVFIDRGEEDEVLPGDIFTIYRMNRATQPPVVLGELAVLSVQRPYRCRQDPRVALPGLRRRPARAQVTARPRPRPTARPDGAGLLAGAFWARFTLRAG